MKFRYIGRFDEVNVMHDASNLDIFVKHGEEFEVNDEHVKDFDDQPENYERVTDSAPVVEVSA